MPSISFGRSMQSFAEADGQADYGECKWQEVSRVNKAVDTLGHLLVVHVALPDERHWDRVTVDAEIVQVLSGKSHELSNRDQG
jgi:hypothetical protein